ERGVVDGIADGIAKRDLTVALTRCMIGFLLLAAWAALCRGILNTYRRFFLPALSPALFNLVAVGVGVVLWVRGGDPKETIFAWALGVLAGGALQFLIQVPAVRRCGVPLRWRLDLAHEGFRRILRLMSPALAGLAAVQLNIIVNSRLASDAAFGDGAVTRMTLAYRLVYLPIGVIGVALATVTAVRVSRDVARDDLERFRDGVSTSLRFLVFFTVPSTVGLIVLSLPIVRLVFGHGHYLDDPTALPETAWALTLYSTALFFFCAVKVLVPAFYATDRIRVPLFASLTAIVANLTWALSTIRWFGWPTLVFGTAVAGLFNFAVLAWAFHRWIGRLDYRALLMTTGKVSISLVPMGWVAFAANRGLESWIGTGSLLPKLIGTAVPILAAVVVYFAMGRLLGLREAVDAMSLRRRRR
ncbi:MAG: murein biosynthesis integral membrane protein MurJ, partial [Planctomycetes bacterium]|nr:murein biosynthesis integral membrane protein MurJ [Planctomycetota bacterium]